MPAPDRHAGQPNLILDDWQGVLGVSQRPRDYETPGLST